MEILNIGKAFLLASSVAIVAGCSSTGGTSSGTSMDDSATTGSAVSEAPVTATTDTMNSKMLSAAEQALLDQSTFHFAFDSSTLSTADFAALDVHAKVLSMDSSLSVVVEGHTDERGTREYNLALGERRSKAVKRYLVMKGVAPAQLESVSYGEERPVAEGHEESAWYQNRRAVIVGK